MRGISGRVPSDSRSASLSILHRRRCGGGRESWKSVPGLDSLVSGSWQGIALAVVVGPLTEEILFRGIVLRGLLGRWTAWPAIVTSAALFAAMHFNLAQVPVAFGLGLVF